MTKKIPSLKVPYYHHFKVFIFHSDLQSGAALHNKKKKDKKKRILFTHSASCHDILF